MRAVRHKRGATLAQLSVTTGVSISTLSRLEAGRRRPTLELLLPLARALQVPLEELIGVPATGDPRVHAEAVQHHGRTLFPLTRHPGGMQAYKMVIPPGEPDGELQSHEGYEWMYVLADRLRLRLGELDLVMKSAKSPSSTPTLRTGSAVPGPAPWSCSCSSAHKANGYTSAPGRGRTARAESLGVQQQLSLSC